MTVNALTRLAEDPTTPPEGSDDWLDNLNPESLKVLGGAKLEPALAEARAGTTVQFERMGYFFLDAVDSRPGSLVFNRTITLKDTWAKVKKKGG